MHHPLSPLSAAEITAATDLVRAEWPADTGFQFKVVTLQEPAKAELVPFLAAERAGKPVAAPVRRAYVAYYLRRTEQLHEAVVDLAGGRVERNVRVSAGQHGNGDGEEIVAIEKVALADAGVQAALARLQLPAGAVVVADPWIYGADGVAHGAFRDDEQRAMQVFLYMRDPGNAQEPDSCHYAFPLPVSPVVSCATLEVLRIDVLPMGAVPAAKRSGNGDGDGDGGPVAVAVDCRAPTLDDLRPWHPAPPSEYLPEAQPALRTDLKPLRVVQPEGASFAVAPLGGGLANGHASDQTAVDMGRRLTWQKWDIKVGFNQREGPVLYDVHYDGVPLFYRLSLSDMAIPYADPRPPFHRKQAFDLGDVGAGLMANNLQLGCDCLGAIYYMDGVVADAQGRPVAMPNAVCVHEQDAGLAWKHTNYRTGRAVVARQRELVVQTILTVSNYEYILAWVFNLAGDVAYEVRATGVVSTQPIDQAAAEQQAGGQAFGTVVHPGVLAAHHQHFFSLRIDPMVAGHGNAIECHDTVPLARDAATNPHGVGYTVAARAVATSGAVDVDTGRTGRVVHIANPGVRHPVNGLAAAYRVHMPAMAPMMADAASFHRRRAAFADHAVYVTRYAEGELYAGGRWTNQSRGGTGPEGEGGDGVRTWAARRDSLAGGDAVLWLQFGLNHVPRAEDFPVMPCETLRITLRPANVFARNPALDVPPTSSEANGSVRVCCG